MSSHELEQAFQQTLEDLRLSRSERQALRQLLAESDLGEEERAALLRRAFAAAEDVMSRHADRQVLAWLEAVAKIVATPTQPAQRRTEVTEALFEPQQNCSGRLRSLIDTSHSSIDVCVFTVTDDSLTRSLLHAHRRQVRIRMITDDLKSLDRGSDIERLREAGIPVRFDVDSGHMHHKFALFDQHLVATGSYNWTRGAAESNYENLLVTDHPPLISPFLEEFDRLWKQFAPIRPLEG